MQTSGRGSGRHGQGLIVVHWSEPGVGRRKAFSRVPFSTAVRTSRKGCTLAAQYPSDVIVLVVLWRLRYKLSLRDLPEMFALRGLVFCHG